MKLLAVLWLILLASGAPALTACDLCAVYNADNARSEAEAGFLLTLSEQFIPYRTVQRDGKELPFNAFLNQAYLDSSISHIVPGYNFSERFGLSLNVPVVYHRFVRHEVTLTGARDRARHRVWSG